MAASSQANKRLRQGSRPIDLQARHEGWNTSRTKISGSLAAKLASVESHLQNIRVEKNELQLVTNVHGA